MIMEDIASQSNVIFSIQHDYYRFVSEGSKF